MADSTTPPSSSSTASSSLWSLMPRRGMVYYGVGAVKRQQTEAAIRKQLVAGGVRLLRADVEKAMIQVI
ncbi:Uu.00g099370.m01.CDS01 [Anthostomella pinea]|uniref:Uu.00g099370.m01.CDS01 n=1 Tax=Anthostomella pinea TaxID=933095 RepID=A0AAI8VCV6_9PEZI|nr:Uu.00g099370.m01.CDS01 [Anthostomella pinea]